MNINIQVDKNFFTGGGPAGGNDLNSRPLQNQHSSQPNPTTQTPKLQQIAGGAVLQGGTQQQNSAQLSSANSKQLKGTNQEDGRHHPDDPKEGKQSRGDSRQSIEPTQQHSADDQSVKHHHTVSISCSTGRNGEVIIQGTVANSVIGGQNKLGSQVYSANGGSGSGNAFGNSAGSHSHLSLTNNQLIASEAESVEELVAPLPPTESSPNTKQPQEPSEYTPDDEHLGGTKQPCSVDDFEFPTNSLQPNPQTSQAYQQFMKNQSLPNKESRQTVPLQIVPSKNQPNQAPKDATNNPILIYDSAGGQNSDLTGQVQQNPSGQNINFKQFFFLGNSLKYVITKVGNNYIKSEIDLSNLNGIEGDINSARIGEEEFLALSQAQQLNTAEHSPPKIALGQIAPRQINTNVSFNQQAIASTSSSRQKQAAQIIQPQLNSMRNSSLVNINNRSQPDAYGLHHFSGSAGSSAGGAPLPEAVDTREEEQKLLYEVRKAQEKSKRANKIQEMKVKEEEALWIAKQLANQRALQNHEQMINIQLDQIEKQLKHVNESEDEDDFEKNEEMQFAEDSDEENPRDEDDNSKSSNKDKNAQSMKSKSNRVDDDIDGTLEDEDGQDQQRVNVDRFARYDPYSLYIFSIKLKMRRATIRFVNWKRYDTFMIFCILGNSASLALMDYTDDNNDTYKNQVLVKIDHVFTVIYTAEAVLKTVAFGFVVHKRSYLRKQPWNVFDFVIVMIGLIQLIPSVPNLKAIRVLRVLRPLRTINAVPSMKRLVTTLLISLPSMGYLVSMIMFFIFVYAILGMQFFSKSLYKRCRTTEEPLMNGTEWVWPIDQNQQRLCGGLYQCDNGTYCHALYERDIPLESDRVFEWAFIQYGIFHFDNIGVAVLSIFRVITLEGWSNVMYNYLDGVGITAGIYFPFCVIVGSFFLLKLFLAVIMQTFSEMSMKTIALDISTTLEHYEDRTIKHMINVAKKKIQISHGPRSLNEAALLIYGQAKKELDKRRRMQKQEEAKRLREMQLLKNEEETPISNKPKEIKFAPVPPPVDKKRKSESEAEKSTTQTLMEWKNTSVENLHWIQTKCLIFCTSSFFLGFINVSIIFNTICLGLDKHPSDANTVSLLENINYMFFAIFFIELCVKILGLGPKTFVKDHYNNFDAIVVSLSIIDIFMNLQTDEDGNHNRGPVSAFRAFRLLRVFKLSKSWKQLRYLISTIARTLQDISSFSVLLILLIFIYVLLGMELFAMNPAQIAATEDVNIYPRYNFNDIASGSIVIFTLLTGENWDQTMFQFAHLQGDSKEYITIIFFISFVIIGVMIFLNLFLAILLENFQEDENYQAKESTESTMGEKVNQFLDYVAQGIKDYWEYVKDECTEKKQVRKSVARQMTKRRHKKNRNHRRSRNREIIENDQQFSNGFTGATRETETGRMLIQEGQTPDARTGGREELYFGTNKLDFTSSHNNKQFSVTNQMDNGFNHGLIQIKENTAPFKQSGWRESELAFDPKSDRVTILGDLKMETGQHQRLGMKNPAKSSMKIHPIDGNNGGNLLVGSQTELGVHKLSSSPIREVGSAVEIKHFFPREESKEQSKNSGRSARIAFQEGPNSQEGSVHNSSPSKERTINHSKSIAVVLHERQQEHLHNQQQASIELEKEDDQAYKVLFLFTRKNFLRKIFLKLVNHRLFDQIILLIILVQSILLSFENPLNDPNSELVRWLELSDIVFSGIFAFEALAKIVSNGLIFCGNNSYLRNGWNFIDFIVVILSIVSLALKGKLKIFKIFRLLKVIRPIRVISRNKGLKIGIQALFMAVPNIFNVIIVSLLFFIIFGIIGVNYFKGQFYSCQHGAQIPAFAIVLYEAKLIVSKYDCINYGGAWMNADRNFDNILDAVSTLFQMASTEGWIEVMNSGVDSTDIDMQPIMNFNLYWSLFFILFILFGNFLILNLFVGVVVSTFNKEKELLGKNFLLTDNQKKWLEQKKLVMKIEPKIVAFEHGNLFREYCRKMVFHKWFEFFILGCIVLNTLVLSVNWYGMSDQWATNLDYINYGFAMIFALEAIIKFSALGCKIYFHDNGNSFDFAIVIASIVSSLVSIKFDMEFGASATFIRALRLARILKFVQRAKHVRVIFETLMITIPALTNIGGLLLLFLYMFSVLGVFLFADVKLQSSLDIHANFQSFGYAFMTLVRCSTGEGWNSIMIDSKRVRSIIFQCDDNDFDYDTYVANGYQTYNCGSSASALVFFLIYYLMVPLVFINLFIAIILQGFEQTSQKVNELISERDLEHFRDCWSQYDPKGTGFMRLSDMPKLMLILGDPLGWKKELYQHNQPLQDDYLEELNINTYNSFRDVLFWDVIQALTKVYLIRLSMRNKKLQEHKKENEENPPQKDDPDDEFVEDSIESEDNDPFAAQKEEKLQLRLELEFEKIDDDRQGVHDVEEVKRKENKILGQYISKVDGSLTSAHLKAGRKILQGFKNWKLRKLEIEKEKLQAIEEEKRAEEAEALKNEKKPKTEQSQKKNKESITRGPQNPLKQSMPSIEQSMPLGNIINSVNNGGDQHTRQVSQGTAGFGQVKASSVGEDLIKDYEQIGGDYLGEMEHSKLEQQINSKPSSIYITDDGRPSIGWNDVANGIPNNKKNPRLEQIQQDVAPARMDTDDLIQDIYKNHDSILEGANLADNRPRPNRGLAAEPPAAKGKR